MVGYSSVTLQNLVDDGRCYPDIVSVLTSIPGSVGQPAYQIADRTMRAILSSDFNWKWNRTNLPPFLVVPLQQDYVTSVTNLAWCEAGQAVDINNTSNPKPQWQVRAVRDLYPVWEQGDARGEAFTWIPNNQATMWQWLPNTVIPNGYGTASPQPSPIQQFIDVNGNILYINSASLNLTISSPGISGGGQSIPLPSGSITAGLNNNPVVLTSATPVRTGTIVTITGAANVGSSHWVTLNGSWTATQVGGTSFSVPLDATGFNSFVSQSGVNFTSGPYGTTGTTQPSAPANSAAGTLVQDGTVIWTVADPNGYAIRFVPIAPPGGITYLFNIWYQQKPPRFGPPPAGTGPDQTLSPVPDEMYDLFLEGFIAYARDNSVDAAARAKGPQSRLDWKIKLDEKLRAGDREPTQISVVPAQSIDYRGGGGSWPFGGSLPWPIGNLPQGAGNPFGY
jgi:hypothetical protein